MVSSSHPHRSQPSKQILYPSRRTSKTQHEVAFPAASQPNTSAGPLPLPSDWSTSNWGQAPPNRSLHRSRSLVLAALLVVVAGARVAPLAPSHRQCRVVSGLVIMSRRRWVCRFPGWGQCERRSSRRKVFRPRFAAGAAPWPAPRRRPEWLLSREWAEARSPGRRIE